MVAVVSGHAHDPRLGIEEGLGERRGGGLPTGGHLGIDRTHGVVDERLVGVRRAEDGVGGEHDLLAGQRHEDGMSAGPRREPGHRLHAGEARVGEEAGQRQRSTEVACPRARIVGAVKAEHEHPALAGAGEEPIKIAEDRPLDLRVTGAGDRQAEWDDGHRDVAGRSCAPTIDHGFGRIGRRMISGRVGRLSPASPRA